MNLEGRRFKIKQSHYLPCEGCKGMITDVRIKNGEIWIEFDFAKCSVYPNKLEVDCSISLNWNTIEIEE